MYSYLQLKKISNSKPTPSANEPKEEVDLGTEQINVEEDDNNSSKKSSPEKKKGNLQRDFAHNGKRNPSAAATAKRDKKGGNQPATEKEEKKLGNPPVTKKREKKKPPSREEIAKTRYNELIDLHESKLNCFSICDLYLKLNQPLEIARECSSFGKNVNDFCYLFGGN